MKENNSRLLHSNRRIIVFAVLLSLIAALFAVPLCVYADEEDETKEDETFYLAFASDLHGLDDVIENGMKDFPTDISYVSIIGDMVGDGGGDAPVFQTSSVIQRIGETFGKDEDDN